MNLLTLLLQTTDTLATPPVLTPVETASDLNLWDLACKGGIIMIPLLLLSLLSIYIFVERLQVIRRAAREDNSFMERIKDYIHEGNIDSALKLCKKTNTPYARLIAKGISRLGRPMNDGEKSLMQMYVNQGYDLFLTRCSDGRDINKEDLDKIAQGRVWTGSTAKELGLVDELGGLDKALEIAINKAGIESGYTVMSYPAPKGFFESLMETRPDNYVKARMLSGKIGKYYKPFSVLENFDKCERIQARIPFELNIQ